MDGIFVEKNISMGAPSSLRWVAGDAASIETHLMITDPEYLLRRVSLRQAPIRSLVHWRGIRNLHRTVHKVKSLARRVGVANQPRNRSAGLLERFSEIDQVLS